MSIRPLASLAAGALALLALPASAQQLSLQNAFPGGLPVVGPGAVRFADTVAKLTNTQVRFKVHGPGELSPLPAILENVGSGAIDAGWAYAGFWEGRIPAAGLFGSIPFGPDPIKYLAWTMYGGGLEIWREAYAKHNVVPMPCGVIISEAGGWYTRKIEKPDDFKGLRFRIGGLGGRVLTKLGANPVLLPIGEVSTALETGRIDGVEVSFPLTDRPLGYWKSAKNYYFPGWHQPAGFTELIINKGVWDKMGPEKQKVIEAACAEVNVWGIGSTAAAQSEPLAFIRAQGVNVARFPDPVIAALRKATDEVLAEQSAADPLFRKALESYRAYSAGYEEYRALTRID
jgi:TRAP-type mannitol/chloroaromatic compound transport system substrate-binding protein